MASGATAVTTSLSRDEQLRGRQNVRYALRNLTPDIQAFYNPKLKLEEMNDLYDRPLDIVLLHKTKGLLGIVIKSGEIVEENGDLVSQYQPAKQYYKIIDPIKQLQKAMTALLDECDPGFKEFVPYGHAVVFPDTLKAEFSKPNPLFLFSENLSSSNLQKDVEELFVETWDIYKTQKYAENFKRIEEFLKSHSDNNIQRVERKETLTKLGVREEKKAFQLPQKAAPGTAAKAAAPKRAVQVEQQAALAKQQKNPAHTTAERYVPVQADLLDHKPVISKPIIEAPVERKPLRTFLQNVEEHFKRDEQVELTGHQWGMVIAIAAIVICVAYFIGRNAGIIMRM